MYLITISLNYKYFFVQKANSGCELNDEEEDGKSVDYVLVYLDINSNNINNAQKREAFEKSLVEQGLQLQYEQNRQLCFVKIYASKVYKYISFIIRLLLLVLRKIFLSINFFFIRRFYADTVK